MKKNNSIKRAIQDRQRKELPSGFTESIMKKVYAEEKKKRKRFTIYSVIALSAATGSLIGLAYYIIVYRINFTFKVDWQIMHFKPTNSIYTSFYIPIAVWTLFLLFLDYAIRNRKKKKE